jgi:hypothetical protein
LQGIPEDDRAADAQYHTVTTEATADDSCKEYPRMTARPKKDDDGGDSRRQVERKGDESVTDDCTRSHA